MAAPRAAPMERFGVNPRPTADPPSGHFCCNGYKPVAAHWQSETEAEEAVSHNLLDKLVSTDDVLALRERELAETRTTLASTSKELSSTKIVLSETSAELASTKAELETAQTDLEAADKMLKELDEELEICYNALSRREKQQAETRWNFAAKHQALTNFSERLKFQGRLRREMLQKTMAQRTELIAEVEAERAAQLVAAQERLVEATKLRDEVSAGLSVLSEALAAKANALISNLDEDLEDARADAQLAGSVYTGGKHPRVERLKQREALKTAETATEETAAAEPSATEPTEAAAAAPPAPPPTDEAAAAAAPKNTAAESSGTGVINKVASAAVSVASAVFAAVNPGPTLPSTAAATSRSGPTPSVASVPAPVPVSPTAIVLAPTPRMGMRRDDSMSKVLPVFTPGPGAIAASEAFGRIDANSDGAISKIELIRAVRVDADVRSLLSLPEAIRQEDGTRDAFEAVFQQIDVDNTKTISRDQFLAAFGHSQTKAPATPRAKALLRARDAKRAGQPQMKALTHQEPAAGQGDTEGTEGVPPMAAVASFALQLGSLVASNSQGSSLGEESEGIEEEASVMVGNAVAPS